MDQEHRLFHFIETTLALLERMQHTPTADYPSMKQNIHTFSLRVMEAKELLIQEALIDPMRDDVRDLIVSLKKGILEFMRFFDVQSSEEYTHLSQRNSRSMRFSLIPALIRFTRLGWNVFSISSICQTQVQSQGNCTNFIPRSHARKRWSNITQRMPMEKSLLPWL